LIDCQPTMGQLTINALVASNEVIVPLQCEYFALHGFIELKGNIEKVKNFLNPELNLIGILATMYEKKTLHNREVLTAILEKYPEDVFETIIAKTIRFSETTVAGEPITSYASSSGGAASYRRLARELIARGGAR
jgi:chromosome partitioning protein